MLAKVAQTRSQLKNEENLSFRFRDFKELKTEIVGTFSLEDTKPLKCIY